MQHPFKKNRISRAIRHLELAGEQLDPVVADNDELAHELRDALEKVDDAFVALIRIYESKLVQKETPP